MPSSRPMLAALAVATASLLVSAFSGAKPPPRPKPGASARPFDRGAAAKALAGVELARCKVPNAPRGKGHAKITFEPTGAASSVEIDSGPMVGTPVAKCIAAQYGKARVPAFDGEPVKLGKSFTLD